MVAVVVVTTLEQLIRKSNHVYSLRFSVWLAHNSNYQKAAASLKSPMIKVSLSETNHNADKRSPSPIPKH
jgi:hypothetical protein